MIGSVSHILLNEVRRLRKEESGVALMLTLSVFLLLYVVCAGVYSIGETVRQKIEIQNACDSAAYSAALVQADGLSRMAMINRAMSWTYVQLTNMQIDFITYQWLRLVENRFKSDREGCKAHNAGSSFSSLAVGIPWPSKCNESSAFTSAGSGWFCGVASTSLAGVAMPGLNKIRINNSSVVDVDEIGNVVRNATEIEKYEALIAQFKGMIAVYNALLVDVSTNMQNSVAQTAQAVLYENLPRKDDGEIDVDQAKDFLAYRDVYYSFSPYLLSDDGELLGQGGCFSPMLNTEADERVFLTMADGKVHDKLVRYFGPQSDGSYIAGGLDQWFIRSYPEETASNAPSIAPSFKIADNLGICRVYKNANRMSTDPGQTLSAYRAHHHAVDASGDSAPSCINTKSYCPEQCRTIEDSYGLCADYEWSAGKYDFNCYHVHWMSGSPPKPHCTHIHNYSDKFLQRCAHYCGDVSSHLGSHARTNSLNCIGYKSCVSEKKSLDLPYALLGITYMNCYAGVTFDDDWRTTQVFALNSNTRTPNGFARIYGDDQEIYRQYADCYVGEPAKPWLLNENFYGRAGAIVVGLARRQRNPWTWLLNGMKAIGGAESTGEDSGIYSAFNPVDGGYITAFSASRAAHRFSGSPHADAWEAGAYETRFDTVCEESKFVRRGEGCVCQSSANEARLARCWNLCETDWDATLVPVKFAWAASTTDSSDGSATVWDPDLPGVDDTGRNPIAFAAENNWIRFYSASGELEVSDGAGSGRDGSFLAMRSPLNIGKGETQKFAHPMGQNAIEINKGVDNTKGTLELNKMILNRIL